MTDAYFKESIYFRREKSSTVLMIKDGRSDMQMEAIVLRPLFSAGDKAYLILSREIESGFYCEYQGGISPNI